MNPNKEKLDRQRAIQEKHKQMEIPIELIKIQDRYNKSNLEQQHKLNLEIHKKNSRLTIILTLLTAFCSVVATIGGVLIGYYLNTSPQKKTPEIQSQKERILHQDKFSTKVAPVHQEKETKSTGQGESSSSNVSSKTP